MFKFIRKNHHTHIFITHVRLHGMGDSYDSALSFL